MASTKGKGLSDQKFEAGLEEYIDAVVAIEKNEYRPDLKPFAAREREIRARIDDAFRSFHKDFAAGYQALVQELKHEMETMASNEDLLALARVDAKKTQDF